MKKMTLVVLSVMLGICYAYPAKRTTTETFYGTKARNSDVNPCKGRTKTICGTVTTTIEEYSVSSVHITKTFLDSERRVIDSNSYVSFETGDQVISRIQQMLPPNATLTIEIDNDIEE